MENKDYLRQDIIIRSQKIRDIIFSIPDKIVTLSVGALAISVAFQNGYVSAYPVCPALLSFSWMSLIAAIITGIFLYYGRARQEFKMLQKLIGKYNNESPVDKPEIEDLGVFFKVIFLIHGLSFVMGLFFLAWFAVLNNF
ncbi:hypothetical protein EST62_08365 [Chlorobaculum sp. 24CR]|uniref:hypothetical protein n=1 Tax=Chlorobaculum sp. 24CR TaxID=2508878 RepID=UPI00100A2F56|nr:hypothetical protein [Chlorobaculum sp. 24CR]RXK84944.1 hypothetical protein EST62_08365 [Chlorobaculum sp. 24CR]